MHWFDGHHVDITTDQMQEWQMQVRSEGGMTRTTTSIGWVERLPGESTRFSASVAFYEPNSAQVTDVLESEPWTDVHAAVQWARGKTDEVLVVCGIRDSDRFSAGVTPLNDLPQWPPSPDVLAEIENATRNAWATGEGLAKMEVAWDDGEPPHIAHED